MYRADFVENPSWWLCETEVDHQVAAARSELGASMGFAEPNWFTMAERRGALFDLLQAGAPSLLDALDHATDDPTKAQWIHDALSQIQSIQANLHAAYTGAMAALPQMTYTALQKVYDDIDCHVPGRMTLEMPAPASRRLDIAPDQFEPTRVAVLNALVPVGMREWASGRAELANTHDSATGEQKRTARGALRSFDTPWINRLRHLAEARSEHWIIGDEAVQKSVLAALELDAASNAESDLDQPNAQIHGTVAAEAGMSTGDEWCGMFAMHQYLKEGMAAKLKKGFFHTNNLLDFFQYTYDHNADRVAHWIWAEEKWWYIKDYHESKGSLRRWLTDSQIRAGGTLDIQPGDVVLLDVHGTSTPDPDHICMVDSYDHTTNMLDTIGGNDSGYIVDPKTDDHADTAREVATGHHLKPGSGGHVAVGEQDLANQPTSNRKSSRIYGIGRVSLVDLETHIYSMDRKLPTKAPQGALTARPE